MHKTMVRLYEVAKLRGLDGPTAVANHLNISPQVVNNWERRGISKAGLLQAEEVFACSATWLRTGVSESSRRNLAAELPKSNVASSAVGGGGAPWPFRQIRQDEWDSAPAHVRENIEAYALGAIRNSAVTTPESPPKPAHAKS
ncbi:MAG: helix-turn-helix domain-containing protein [Pseudomonadales bacterium]